MASASSVVSRFKQALTIPREYHLPKEVRDKAPIVPEGTDLMIWTWESQGPVGDPVPYGIAFAGKQSKPLWNYRFRNEAQRDRQIEETTKSRRLTLKYKQDRLDERKNYKHDFVNGDILYTAWGYDQTNVDFYQVVEVKGALIVVRKVSEIVKSESQSSEQVVAKPDSFIGPPIRVKPGVNGAKIEGHHASKWDGKPKHQTAFGWGH